MTSTETARTSDISADEAFERLVDYGLFNRNIPPCFYSKGLSCHVPTELLPLTTEDNNKKLKALLAGRQHDFVRYESLRATPIPRQMGIPHPESHIIQCLSFQRHWEAIVTHCAKSRVPLSRVVARRISGKPVFAMNYEELQDLEEEQECLRDRRAKTAREEMRSMTGARYRVHADIANYFPSIYTHAISWALHGLSVSKAHRNCLLLAGNLLDKATQGARDGQTNGILVGPHTSNIISEILLTTIDNVMARNGRQPHSRRTDDYTYYATDHGDATKFIRDLAIQLRKYGLMLNEKKTAVLQMPRPLREQWVRELNGFPLPTERGIGFESVAALMDVALTLARGAETNAVWKYAIKRISSLDLADQARRLFVQYTVNLTLLHPYLAPILGEYVFDKHQYDGIKDAISEFTRHLLEIGIQKIYPDAVAHALYYAIKYRCELPIPKRKLRSYANEIIEIDDCISEVLLFEYSKRFRNADVTDSIRERADGLKNMERRESDRWWLLIYELWGEEVLRDQRQSFLATLKGTGFRFLRFENPWMADIFPPISRGDQT